MLPRETSLRQLKMLRKLTKGTDIGDITKDDRLNHNVPNLQYIGNPIDTGIDSYEEFTEKDNELQTIAFKSKLVNKPIVKENNKEKMENNIISFNEYNEYSKSDFIEPKMGDVIDDGIDDEGLDDEGLDIDYIKHKKNSDKKIRKFDEEDVPAQEEEIIRKRDQRELSKKKSLAFESKKEFELLGKEKEPKSNPNFGYAAVRDQEIKKIAFFDNFPIDPKTPKERTIGGSAGQFIYNDEVKGFVNRIEGKNVYIESVDDPMVIKKFNIKDVVKTKKD